MGQFLQKFGKVSLALALMFSGLTLTTQAEETTTIVNQAVTTYEEGVTVVEDAESPTGYTAHFVYNAEADAQRFGLQAGENIAKVAVSGTFSAHSNETPTMDDFGHGIAEFENGDFVANIHPLTWTAGYAYDMTLNEETGCFELSMPISSGAHCYSYTIQVADDEGNVIKGTTVWGQETEYKYTIDDPKNLAPARENEANSDSETTDIANSIVYGAWDETKQSESPNLDFMAPYTGDAKGTVKYVSYTGNKKADQDMGIYLPANYDANREEPYKVIYLSHGAGGNETYWFGNPQATNVMDHIAAENPEQEAIIVGLDNTLYNWDYPQIADNVINYVIPYMEENYNVSTHKQDRAFAGFSMGSMVTSYMAFHHADEFGYFGIFSGTNITCWEYEEGFELDRSRFNTDEAYRQEVYDATLFSQDLLDSVVFTQAGNFDTAVLANGWTAYMAYEMIRDVMEQNMPEGHFTDGGLVPGSHDIYTWGQCLYNFAKDICWSHNVETGYEVSENTTEVEVENQVTFTLVADDIESAVLKGGFQFFTEEDVEAALETPGFPWAGDITPKTAYEYEEGMFAQEYAFPAYAQLPYNMEEVTKGVWEVTLPLPNGKYAYWFETTDANGTATTATQYAFVGEAEADGYVDTAIEGDGWVYPRTDGKTGSVTYVDYEGANGIETTMGVYLPANYDESKTYKTLYLSHGGAGVYTDWFEQGNTANIFDNLIAAGKVDETIVITLDHERTFGWDFKLIKENLMDYVIPFVEENYSVSKDARDRAFAGLSMGGFTTSSVFDTLAGEFGYLGIWSYSFKYDGNEEYSSYQPTNKIEDVPYKEYPTIMLGYGKLDFGRTTYPALMESLESVGVEYHLHEVGGGHEWSVWNHLLSIFAEEYLWEDVKDANPTEVTTQTGDDANFTPFIVMGSVAMVAMAVVALKRKEEIAE